MIEGASGDSYLHFMHTRVIEPLHLAHTSADWLDSIIQHRTRYYARSGGTWVNTPAVDNSYKWAGGGFLSTGEDLVTYGSALLQPGFLKAETLRLLFTSQRMTDGRETGYGIGWFIGKDSTFGPVFSHGGGSVGGTSELVILPASRLVIAIVTNMTDARIGDLPRQLEGVFLRR